MVLTLKALLVGPVVPSVYYARAALLAINLIDCVILARHLLLPPTLQLTPLRD